MRAPAQGTLHAFAWLLVPPTCLLWQPRTPELLAGCCHKSMAPPRIVANSGGLLKDPFPEVRPLADPSSHPGLACRWYADVSAAAEQAHRSATTAAARGLRRRQAGSAAAQVPATFAASLQGPMQARRGADTGCAARCRQPRLARLSSVPAHPSTCLCAACPCQGCAQPGLV